MRVEVKVHRDAAAEYRDWVDRNAAPPGHVALAQVLEAELLAELERTHGRPLGAVFLPAAVPPVWVWRYNADTWIAYSVHDFPGWLRARLRKVVIRRVSDRPLP